MVDYATYMEDDRERVLAVLRHCTVQGCMTPTEFVERADAAYDAHSRRDLRRLTADLPTEVQRKPDNTVTTRDTRFEGGMGGRLGLSIRARIARLLHPRPLSDAETCARCSWGLSRCGGAALTGGGYQVMARGLRYRPETPSSGSG